MISVGLGWPFLLIPVGNRDKPWFDDQCRRAFFTSSNRLIFGGPVIDIGLTRKSPRADETYLEAKR